MINRRLTDGYFNDWVYLLADRSFDYVAGNAKSWPATLRGREGWSTIAPADWLSEAAQRVSLRATSQTLPDGHHLLLGRNIDDLDRFGESVTIGLASAATLFLVLAAAAGISTSRRKGREEALAHGVVIGLADRTHRGSHTCLTTAVAELDRGVLRTLVGVVEPQRHF
jgi:hypothetical protein